MKIGVLSSLIIAGVLIFSACNEHQSETQVESLLSKMTLEEKVSMLGGTGFETKPIERLGIPELRMADGPLGVRWDEATAFPATLGLSSSWDTDLMHDVGVVLANEMLAKKRHMLLAPCINLVRVPMGGRNFESMGEDPYLTSKLVVPYVKGVQSLNVATSVKHFAANNQEDGRMWRNVIVDERTMREIYLPAFYAAIKEGDAKTIMAAYNRLNGHFCAANDWLLNKILKEEWGFEGFVVSDWGAVHSTVKTANYGVDLEMPNGKYMSDTLVTLVNKGTVDTTVINDKVRRILRVMEWCGLLDKKEFPKGALNTQEHRDLALRAAKESIVLLKNENGILPLNDKELKTIAVIGPNAKECRTGGGGSSRVNPKFTVTPLEGIQKRFGGNSEILFAKGTIMEGEFPVIDSKHLKTLHNGNEVEGLTAEFFNNINFEGEPVFTRIDKKIDFTFGDSEPVEGIGKDEYAIRWTGKIVPEKSGTYEIGLASDDGIRLFINDELVIENWVQQPTTYSGTRYVFKAGKEYDVKIEYYENFGSAACHFRWELREVDYLDEAIDVAKKSDVAIVMAGYTANHDSEGFDRENLSLPEDQITLINEVAKVNDNVIVVLTNGGPVVMDDWLDNVDAVVEAWYLGQETGDAIAAVLSGDFNPSGKLTCTFPNRWEDSPAYGTYPGEEDSTIHFKEGIFVGYRYFDEKNIEPLFPFGYGLSYSTFEYSEIENIRLSSDQIAEGTRLNINFKVKNTSDVDGTEIVQLYIKDVESSVPRPPKELKGFAKVELKAGEEKNVTMKVSERDLAFYDVSRGDWYAEPGEFKVLIGSSSRDIRLSLSFTLD